MQVAPLVAKIGTNSNCITCWSNLEPILVASTGGQILNRSQPHSMPVRVLLLLQEENQSGDEKVTVATNTCSYSKQGAQLMVVMVVMLLVMMGLVAVVVMGQQILAFMQEKSSLAALGASGFSFGAGGGVGISMIATSR